MQTEKYIMENLWDAGCDEMEISNQTGSSEGTSVSATMNGTVCRAHLNAGTAAQDLISRLPLILT